MLNGKTEFDFAEGEMLPVNKPLTWTSFNVVSRVRGMLKHKLRLKLKVGHAGTLDPLATGLLIICTGKFTKKIDTYQAQEKEYTGTFCIGATTPCFDLEKPVDETFPVAHITDEAIYAAAQQFTGKIQQVPPLFSAIKVDGKRAYDLARSGDEETVLKSREIEITAFDITRITHNENTIDVDFRVECSKGTYIRSLARDFGIALGSGAHLTALCRTRIGEVRLADAVTLEQLQALVDALPEPVREKK